MHNQDCRTVGDFVNIHFLPLTVEGIREAISSVFTVFDNVYQNNLAAHTHTHTHIIYN